MIPTRNDMEALARRQREARAVDQPVPAVPEDWDLSGADLLCADLRGAVLTDAVLACADLRGAVLIGAKLGGTDLRGAVLRGAVLRGADLSGADLRDATIAEGTVAGAVAGRDGGYHWHAVRVTDGTVILRYGCDRATLAEWRTRGPEYGAQYSLPPEHWATGPAVAIAAAEALAAG